MRIHYTATVWHGGFYQFFTNALRSLGHEVVFFNDAGTKAQANIGKLLRRIPKFEYRAEERVRRAVSRDWLKNVKAANPDILILEHAPNILPEAIREARALQRPILYWMDSPAVGAQAKDALAGMAYADKVFTIDRSPSWMTILYNDGQAAYLPLAGDPDVFCPLPDAQKKYDIAFVGSFPPQNGDGYLRAKLLSEIPERYRVAVCGSGLSYWYKYFPQLRKRVVEAKRLSAEALNEFYNASKLVLNIHSTWHFTSVSARTFEIALAGSFQLVDHRADHDELFPRDTLVTFRSPREIAPLLNEWLAPEKENERMRRAASVREHVLAHHTWKHRAEAMLKIAAGA